MYVWREKTWTFAARLSTYNVPTPMKRDSFFVVKGKMNWIFKNNNSICFDFTYNYSTAIWRPPQLPWSKSQVLNCGVSVAILGTGETAWIPKIATPDGTECANKLNVDVIIQFIDLSCSSYIPNRRTIKCRPFIYLIQKYFIFLDNYSVIQNVSSQKSSNSTQRNYECSCGSTPVKKMWLRKKGRKRNLHLF